MTFVDKNLNAIYDFAERHTDVNMVMALIPNAAYICDQLRPANAPVRDQSKDLAHVNSIVGTALNFVDMEGTMAAHKDEYIYYKTDHHWTSLGAYYAFETLSSELDIASPVWDYDIYPVSTSFSGTLASKSGYHKAQDEIDIYVPRNVNTDCVVNYIDEQKKSASIYVSSALEQKDQYEVFFGGNYSRVDISTANEENRSLLLIKDSYANCFVQFLLPYYRNIIMVDPRYYYEDIDQLIDSTGITDVLFLYNVNTFMTDRSIASALEKAEVSDENDTDVSDEGSTDVSNESDTNVTNISGESDANVTNESNTNASGESDTNVSGESDTKGSDESDTAE